MADIDIRVTGRAGRITLHRPKALNALTYEMCLAVDAVLRDWAKDDAVALVVIDAEGDKAFCAGGDIADLYATGTAGDYAYGQRFWRDEYRMNARVAEFPKPVVSLLQGFTMGGGVGLGCHGSHRVVDDSSRIAMPECGIGLVPDVGGSYLLAQAPGRMGVYLGLTAARMGPGDAILCGFADHYVPRSVWPDLVETLEKTGDAGSVPAMSEAAPEAALTAKADEIDRLFARTTLAEVAAALEAENSDFAAETLKTLRRNSPLAMAIALEMQRRYAALPDLDMRTALGMEYRYTWRAMEHSDFLEGVRAQIIDKDRQPKWRHALDAVPDAAVAALLEPLGADALTFEEEKP